MFVAVVPPASAREDLEEFLAPRRDATAGDGLRWTLPDQWHLTLAFLAEVPERALEDLFDRLERAAAKRRRIGARIAGGGAFPNPARARVLYAAFEFAGEADRTELSRLATGARAAAGKAGIEVPGERFRPHLTLARGGGSPFEATRWLRVLEAYRGPEFTLDTLTLIASHLGEGPRRRPRYEEVASFPLGGPGRTE